MKFREAIKFNEKDNVLVLPGGARKGDRTKSGITLLDNVPAGHKIAAEAIAANSPVIKYGHAIGSAKTAVKQGEWVHEHNVATRLGTAAEKFPPERTVSSAVRADKGRTREDGFMGYRREKGRAGIRNDLWIIPAVGCVNGELRSVMRAYEKPDWIDDVKLLEHPYGCSQLGEDIEKTADILGGLACNPNAAGVLIVGLGCENLQIPDIMERVTDKNKVARVILQEKGSAVIHGLLDELAERAQRERERFPISDLCVGVKCGGSDSYSGFTANPLVGRFSDILTKKGGTVLATEIPEMFGAESVIAERIHSDEGYDKFIALDKWFRDFFIRHGQPIYENPSPGNRAGGITTLEEKSLGAVEKTGRAPVTQILNYGEQVKRGGGVQITFSPGNDIVSCTALAGSGAQIILFTTGRGTPFGSVVPTVKISTNTPLFQKHGDWIDFDAGVLLDGASWEGESRRLVSEVLEIATGRRVNHERKRNFDIAVFKDGVTL